MSKPGKLLAVDSNVVAALTHNAPTAVALYDGLSRFEINLFYSGLLLIVRSGSGGVPRAPRTPL